MSIFYKNRVNQKQIYSKCIQYQRKAVKSLKKPISEYGFARSLTFQQQNKLLSLSMIQIDSIIFNYSKNQNIQQFKRSYTQTIRNLHKVTNPRNNQLKTELILKLTIYLSIHKNLSQIMLDDILIQQSLILKYLVYSNSSIVNRLIENQRIGRLIIFFYRKNSDFIQQYGEICIKIYNKYIMNKQEKSVLLPSEKQFRHVLKTIIQKQIIKKTDKNQNKKNTYPWMDKILKHPQIFYQSLSKQTIQIVKQYQQNKDKVSSSSHLMMKKRTLKQNNTVQSHSISRNSGTQLIKNISYRDSINKKNSKNFKRFSHQYDLHNFSLGKQDPHNNTFLQLVDSNNSEVKQERQSDSDISINTSQEECTPIQAKQSNYNKKFKKSYKSAFAKVNNYKYIYIILQSKIQIAKIQKYVLRKDDQKNKYHMYLKIQNPKINNYFDICITRTQYLILAQKCEQGSKQFMNQLLIFQDLLMNSITSYFHIDKSYIGIKLSKDEQIKLNYVDRFIEINNQYNTYFFNQFYKSDEYYIKNIYNMNFDMKHEQIKNECIQVNPENIKQKNIKFLNKKCTINKQNQQIIKLCSINLQSKQDTKVNILVKHRKQLKFLQRKQDNINKQEQILFELNHKILVSINKKKYELKLINIRKLDSTLNTQQLYQYQIKQIYKKTGYKRFKVTKQQIQKLISRTIQYNNKIEKFIHNFSFQKSFTYNQLVNQKYITNDISKIKMSPNLEINQFKYQIILHKYTRKIQLSFIIIYIIFHKFLNKLIIRVYQPKNQIHYQNQFDWKQIISNPNLWMFCDQPFQYFLKQQKLMNIFIKQIICNLELEILDKELNGKLFGVKFQFKVFLLEQLTKSNDNNQLIGKKAMISIKELQNFKKDMFFRPKVQILQFSYQKLTKDKKNIIKVQQKQVLNYFNINNFTYLNPLSSKDLFKKKYFIICLSDLIKICKHKFKNPSKNYKFQFFQFINKSFYKIVVKKKYLEILNSELNLIAKINLNDINKKIPFFKQLTTLQNTKVIRERILHSLKIVFPLLFL